MVLERALTFMCLVCGLILIIPTSKIFLDLSFFKELKKTYSKVYTGTERQGIDLVLGYNIDKYFNCLLFLCASF